MAFFHGLHYVDLGLWSGLCNLAAGAERAKELDVAGKSLIAMYFGHSVYNSH